METESSISYLWCEGDEFCLTGAVVCVLIRGVCSGNMRHRGGFGADAGVF